MKIYNENKYEKLQTHFNKLSLKEVKIYKKKFFYSMLISVIIIVIELLFFFATLRKVKILTWQNPEQQKVAQVLKKFNL